MSGPKRTVRAYLTDTLGGTQRPDTPAIVNDMSQAIKTSNVFVPGRYPRHTYNPRSDRELEESLRTYLDDGGAILTLVGPTRVCPINGVWGPAVFISGRCSRTVRRR